MSKIRIKNFGPIKEGFLENDGWIDIKKVTLFIGNQGSGKSTVAKLISTFTWIEKALNRGDIVVKTGNDIIKYISWHRMGSYLLDQKTEIEYIGEKYAIIYNPTDKRPWPIVEEIVNGNYVVPKIMYVPSERNFLSTIKDAFDITNLPGPLLSFAEEMKRAQVQLNGLKLDLPFDNFSYEYDDIRDVSYVIGNNYKIDLLDASSGLHSLIPLFLVTRNLSMEIEFENVPEYAPISANQSVRRDREISNIMRNPLLSSEEKDRQSKEIFAKYYNKCFINIVEEPEQNLYPISQRATLNSLLKFNNMNDDNKLIVTTHSPYLINYLTLNIEAYNLTDKIKKAGKESLLNKDVFNIVPEESLVNPSDVAIYEMDEHNGIISLLGNYNGVPSDENKLNYELGQGNEFFAELLEIEQQI